MNYEFAAATVLNYEKWSPRKLMFYNVIYKIVCKILLTNSFSGARNKLRVIHRPGPCNKLRVIHRPGALFRA